MMTFITILSVILTLIHMLACLIAVSVMSKNGWIKTNLENDSDKWRQTVATYTKVFPEPVNIATMLLVTLMLGIVAYIGGGIYLALAALFTYFRVPIAVKEFIEWR